MPIKKEKKRDIPPRAPRKPPDDSPEDMELTIPRQSRDALNLEGSMFDTNAQKRFQGINRQGSVFEKGSVFHPEA
ncbi:MAG: hypothetical protein LBS10_03390 [Gracilibacteraceae bacterium]|jgi:hypothetical protein|nr:hypothetical protein [Gracilibacteraceae bacterium]